MRVIYDTGPGTPPPDSNFPSISTGLFLLLILFGFMTGAGGGGGFVASLNVTAKSFPDSLVCACYIFLRMYILFMLMRGFGLAWFHRRTRLIRIRALSIHLFIHSSTCFPCGYILFASNSCTRDCFADAYWVHLSSSYTPRRRRSSKSSYHLIIRTHESNSTFGRICDEEFDHYFKGFKPK